MKGKIIKIIIIIAIVFIAAILFFSSKSDKNKTNTSTVALSESKTTTKDKQKLIAQGEEILRILNLLGEINLDADIFSEPAYLSLGDFSVSLPEKEIGKSNPFSSLK